MEIACQTFDERWEGMVAAGPSMARPLRIESPGAVYHVMARARLIPIGKERLKRYRWSSSGSTWTK